MSEEFRLDSRFIKAIPHANGTAEATVESFTVVESVGFISYAVYCIQYESNVFLVIICELIIYLISYTACTQ
jgi:hypothetical protein